MLRIGVCGTATWAKIVHLPGFAAHPRTQLVGVFGRKPERRAELAECFGIAAFDSLEAMLGAVEVVSFVVPPRVQSGLAARAAREGKHLMLEKPLAAGLKEGTVLHAAVRKAGIASVCFLTRMFVPAVDAFCRQAEQLRPSHADATFRSGALLKGSPYHGSAWRQEETGALWDAAPHPLSVLVAACGPITRVSARMLGKGHVTLAATHHGGCASTVEVDLCDPTSGLTERYDLRKGARTATLEGFVYDRGAAFARAIDALVRRIEEGGNRSSDLTLPMHLMAVLDSAETSLKAEGRTVEVIGEESS